MNVIRSIEAIRKDDLANFTVDTLHLDHKSIPAGVHIFRLVESMTVIIVSDAFVKAIWDKKPKGIAFMRTMV